MIETKCVNIGYFNIIYRMQIYLKLESDLFAKYQWLIGIIYWCIIMNEINVLQIIHDLNRITERGNWYWKLIA